MTIPDVINPWPALLIDRAKGQVGWFRNVVLYPDVWPEVGWTEAVIVFWNKEKHISGTVASFSYS